MSKPLQIQPQNPTKTVLVTGANGYLGNAIARAFSRAGWKTYGLIRKPAAIAVLLRHEVLPIIGSAKNHTEWLRAFSFSSQSEDDGSKEGEREAVGEKDKPIFDVVVTTTEDMSDWEGHFQDNLGMIRMIARERMVGRKLKGLNEGVGPDKRNRLLVLYTSGCKDYGTTKFHGDEDLTPHTESSDLNPPGLIRPRTENSLRILKCGDDATNEGECFDAVSLRPTTFFGHSATYYGILFDLASKALVQNGGNGVLELEANPNSILHGTHVDDAGDAYVALAQVDRSIIRSQVYNISSSRYDTLSEVVIAMEKSYGIKVEYRKPSENFQVRNFVDVTVMFPQWVGSEKIRKDVGWTDRRMGFVEGFEVYRRTFEQLAEDGDEGVKRVRGLANFTF